MSNGTATKEKEPGYRLKLRNQPYPAIGWIDKTKQMSLDQLMRDFFPAPKNVSAKTIADELQPVTPRMEVPKIRETYKNHMGEDVTVYENGSRSIHSYDSRHLYGDSGHSFGQGFYIVNESGQMVFAGSEEYDALAEKCRPFWKILKGLQEKFKGYSVETSRGNRIAVNDKIIKGILLYPGMRITTIEETIESIAEFIQKDIDRGRIIKGQYGV